jgi:hypothetical protein
LSFIKRIIGPDEKLIGLSTVHWIYGAKGIVWLGGMMLVGLTFRTLLFSFFVTSGIYEVVPASGVFGNYFFWTATVLGAVMFFFYLLIMVSTEIALTTKRVIFKRGLIAVDVREVDLEEIKAADVNNGWFGRFLNYGYLLFDARFVQNLQLPAIGDPYRFVKALNEARTKVRGDSMRVILDGVADGRAVSAVQSEAPAQENPAHLADEKYKSLSNDPAREIQDAVNDMRKKPQIFGSQTKNIRQLKPVVYNKAELREKAKSNFHMISHYGNKF